MSVATMTSAQDEQRTIAEEFSLFGDWTERYQYLIDLGRTLPDFPAQARTEANRLHGCQSMVWVLAQGDAERLDFRATSESAIVDCPGVARVLRPFRG